MNQNGTHNIAQESLTALFTALTANQQRIRILVGARENNQAGWGRYLAVPDELHSRQDYLGWICSRKQGQDGDDRKPLYNCRLLEEFLTATGFNVESPEYFDERGEFYCQAGDGDQGLIKRSPRFDPRNNTSFDHNFDQQIPATFAQEYSDQGLAGHYSSPRSTYYTSTIVGAWKLS